MGGNVDSLDQTILVGMPGLIANMHLFAPEAEPRQAVTMLWTDTMYP